MDVEAATSQAEGSAPLCTAANSDLLRSVASCSKFWGVLEPERVGVRSTPTLLASCEIVVLTSAAGSAKTTEALLCETSSLLSFALPLPWRAPAFNTPRYRDKIRDASAANCLGDMGPATGTEERPTGEAGKIEQACSHGLAVTAGALRCEVARDGGY